MKNATKWIIFLPCIFLCYSTNLQANSTYTSEKLEPIYLNEYDIAFEGKDIFVHLANDWIQAHALRSDHQGFYVLNQDLVQAYGSRYVQPPKKWKCPYCFHMWEMGEKCQNKDCPTNQWDQKEEEQP